MGLVYVFHKLLIFCDVDAQHLIGKMWKRKQKKNNTLGGCDGVKGEPAD